MVDKYQKRSDALAQLSGVIQQMSDYNDDIKADYVAQRFNDVIEDNDIESDVLPIEIED